MDVKWNYIYEGVPDGAQIELRGNNLVHGNGYLGVRGTLEEYGPNEKVGIMVNGLYDRQGDAWREPVNLPNPFFVKLWDKESKAFHLESRAVIAHVHGIDMEKGIHWRETTYDLGEGDSLTVDSKRFVSQEKPDLMVMQYRVRSSRPMELSCSAPLDTKIWDINGPHLESIEVHNSQWDPWGTQQIFGARTCEKGIPVKMLVTSQWTGPWEASASSSDGLSRTIRLEPGIEAGFDRWVRVSQGLTGHNSIFDSYVNDDRNFDLRAQLKAHINRWKQMWSSADIVLEGDDELQKLVRFNLYHLLSILPPQGSGLSVPARGLSAQVYKGAIFWDTEIFMLPFYQAVLPERARELLLYRINGLQGALDKSRQLGYNGAFYPWEGQDGNLEACTRFNITDVITGRPLRTFFMDKQIHISADVVLALQNYVKWSDDLTLLSEGGAAMVYRCAEFFLSWASYRVIQDRYDFLDVTGPDEYHEGVNNNFFTNYAIKKALDYALEVKAYMEAQHPKVHKKTLEQIHVSDFFSKIEHMASRVHVPHGDWKGVIPQFDGYFQLEDCSIEDLKSRKQHPHEYLGGGNGVARWTQVLKQADVVAGLFLDPSPYSVQQLRANWEYYDQRTEHGSSLSSTAYGVIGARIGNIDGALRYLNKTARTDTSGEAKQYVGDLYIGGTHPAAQGGTWITLVQGFAGAELHGNTLKIDPKFPPHWKSLAFKLTVKGQLLSILISNDGLAVSHQGERESISVDYRGEVCEMEPGTSCLLSHKRIEAVR